MARTVIWSAWGTGKGRSSMPLITLNTVVLTAIPSPRVTMAMMVKPGEFASVRAAYRRSRQKPLINGPLAFCRLIQDRLIRPLECKQGSRLSTLAMLFLMMALHGKNAMLAYRHCALVAHPVAESDTAGSLLLRDLWVRPPAGSVLDLFCLFSSPLGFSQRRGWRRRCSRPAP